MPNERQYRRRYGDKEVGLILKRAAEFQRLEPESAAEGGGLTLAELEDIAVEAGIDPRLLRRAAEELDAGAARLHREGVERWLGGPVTIELQRSLPGELPESEFETMVGEIQEAAEGHGQASLLGHTLTWRSATPQGERSLQVTVPAACSAASSAGSAAAWDWVWVWASASAPWDRPLSRPSSRSRSSPAPTWSPARSSGPWPGAASACCVICWTGSLSMWRASPRVRLWSPEGVHASSPASSVSRTS
ncbi:MAG: hypothetical protein AMS25_07365 [Gemmatimonas sp. SM23_52]|nr:MAG: hypothetical protein AMS25_07365 [Gemmatimonas sp. SM23_52]